MTWKEEHKYFNNTITIDSLPVFLKSRYVDMLGKCVLCEEIMNTYKEVKYEAVEVEVAVFGLPVDQVRTPEGSERAGGGPNSRATWRNKKLKKPPQMLVNIQPWYFREARLLYQVEKIVQGINIQNLNNKACDEGEEITYRLYLSVLSNTSGTG